MIYLKQSEENTGTLLSPTHTPSHTHINIYIYAPRNINLVLSLPSKPSMSRETTGNSK